MRANTFVFTMASVMSIVACGGDPSWYKEVSRQAVLSLSCGESQVAVERHVGHNYDAVGCEQGVRFVCRDRTCAPTSEPTDANSPAFLPVIRRATSTRRVLEQMAARLSRQCADGRPFATTFLIDPEGKLESIEAKAERVACITQLVRQGPRLPPGRGHLYISIVFRP